MSKVLYLDGDILVLKPLCKLFELELYDYYAAVVRDNSGLTKPQDLYTGDYEFYFNSGMMLLNLDKLRKDEITQKLISYKKINYNDSLMDQNCYNIVFYKNVLFLPCIYNLLYTNLCRDITGGSTLLDINKFYNMNLDFFKDVIDDTIILHFSSKEKPWKFYNTPFSDLWYKYYMKTPIYVYLVRNSIDENLLKRIYIYTPKLQERLVHDNHLELIINNFDNILNNYDTSINQLLIRNVETAVENIIEEYYKIKQDENFNKLILVKNFFQKINEKFNYIIEDMTIYSKFKLILDFNINLTKQYNQTIPIVFSTNDNYIPYLAVAIKSLINNFDNDNLYNIYIFYTSVNKLNQNKILTEFENISNISITFVDLCKLINHKNLTEKGHFTKEMYYRIMIPEILPMYTKVIYLDCDLILKYDITKLFNIDIGDNSLGCVKNIITKETLTYTNNNLGINPNNYFNSGVLVFNINKILQTNAKSVFFYLSQNSKNLWCPDQDILNIIFENDIMFLPSNWNYQYHNVISSKIESRLNDNIFINSHQEFIEKLNDNNPYIYHFSSNKKPWDFPNEEYSEHFWEYAKLTSFYENIIFKSLEKKLSKENYNNNCNTNDQEFNKINGQLKWARNELNKFRKEKLEYKKDSVEIGYLKSSYSYKIGRFITWLPRKIRIIFGG